MIVEYGDYECPYSRAAYRSIEQIEAELGQGIRFVFRHFPLIEIHPHALAASMAAEAAARQGRFWEMHDMLFHRQKALEDDDLRRYARRDRTRPRAVRRPTAVGEAVLGARSSATSAAALASGQVLGTPTLFIDGVAPPRRLRRGTLLAALAR